MTNTIAPRARRSRRMNDVGLMLALTLGTVFGPILVIDAVATFAAQTTPTAVAAR